MGLPPLQPRIPQCPLVTCGMRLKAGGGEKVVLSPNCRVSWQPRGFEAPPAHSSGLGPLVPPEFPAETLVKGSHFVHKTPPSPSMWRKPPCAMQGGIFPCRSQEGQQDKMDPELFHSAPVNCAVLPRTFRALTPVSGECRFYLRTPTPLAIWPLLGHFSEIEIGTQVFSGKFDFNSHRRGS
jgi:hypothetical protein